MNIQGLQKTTLLDYPEHVAATIFLGGCNFRCPFCHNMNIVLASTPSAYSSDDIISFLKKRQGILDGVCITGGEPTIFDDLPDFIRDIKSLNYKVKLDTNGTNSDMVKYLISENLLDYIAMDIKSSLKTYNLVSGISNFNATQILDTIHLLNSSCIDHEFRTTLIKEFHTEDVIEEMGQILQGSPKYFLQSFVDSDFVPNHSLTCFAKEELIQIKNQLSKYVPSVEIRGVSI